MPEPDNKVVQPETADSTPASEETNQQSQQIWETVSGVLSNLPDYVTDFFNEYQRPLITVGLVLTAFISVKLLLAILSAVNEVPLLAPTFELIGIGYSGWFVFRFILKEANRQELGETITSLKDQILGKGS